MSQPVAARTPLTAAFGCAVLVHLVALGALAWSPVSERPAVAAQPVLFVDLTPRAPSVRAPDPAADITPPRASARAVAPPRTAPPATAEPAAPAATPAVKPPDGSPPGPASGPVSPPGAAVPGGSGGAATAASKTDSGPAAPVDDYAAQVLAWVEKHKRYPAHASDRRLDGEALVAVTLDRRGRVVSLDLVRSSGEAVLDEAALDTVRRADPFPPRAGAGPARRRFEVPIRFRPRGRA